MTSPAFFLLPLGLGLAAAPFGSVCGQEPPSPVPSLWSLDAGPAKDGEGRLYITGTTLDEKGKRGPQFFVEFGSGGGPKYTPINNTKDLPHGLSPYGFPSLQALPENAGFLATTEAYNPDNLGAILHFARDGTMTLKRQFTPSEKASGRNLVAGLAINAAGDAFGVTREGGYHDRGVLFRLAADGNFSVLHHFGGTDPILPGFSVAGKPVLGPDGSLYVAFEGEKSPRNYWTTVFRRTPDGKLAAWGQVPGGCNDLAASGSGVVVARLGNSKEGVRDALVRLNGKDEPVELHRWTKEGNDQGGFPDSLISDGAGNLYGVAYTVSDYGTGGSNAVFKLDRGGTFKWITNDRELTPFRITAIDDKGNVFGCGKKRETDSATGKYKQLGHVIFRVSPGGKSALIPVP